MKLKGFTLAEILITLAIIGVVAAMTIPTLIAKINSIVTDNQIKVFNAKLIKGMNLTKTAGDLNNTYESTYDFLVNGLGKNLKMTKICDKDYIRDCIPYDKIKYDKSDNTETSVNTEDLLKIAYTDIAAFVLSDGTPVIASYDLKCIDDPDKADTTINKCFAGIYDLNGTRKPNKIGKDLMTFNGAGIKGAVLATLGGVKIVTSAQVPTPMTKTECEANKSKYGINACYYDNDYWAGAVKMCKDQNFKLPTEEQLAKMATALYGGKQGGGSFSASDPLGSRINGAGSIGSGEAIPQSVLSNLGFSGYLWSNSERDNRYAYYRYYGNIETFRHNDHRARDHSGVRAVCVAN